jgi:sterol desaturase/sphingolipid hydroxylase (fatty acid hydroxylase superfamily)
VFILIPLTLLIELQAPEAALIAVLTGAVWTHFVHLKTGLHFGLMNRLLVTPAYHRIHHSRDASHFDKNFAGVFPVLDVIFGTAHFPKGDEKVETGLGDRHEAGTLREYLLALRPKR